MEGELNVNYTESTAITSEDIEENNGFNYLYIFAPIVFIQIILNTGSNAILIVLIMQFCSSCTSLNIYLFSICSFNTIELFNQIAMIVVIFRRGRYIPTQMCHISVITQNMVTVGIFATHLVLSYDRYIIAKSPLSWTINRKKAWVYTTIIWVGSFVFGILQSLLNLREISGDYRSCLWPNIGTCNRPYKFGIRVVIAVLVAIATGAVYYLYAKTSKELNANEIDKEFKLRSLSMVSTARRQKTVPERAVLSLAVVFSMHIVSQLPLDIYNSIRYLVVMSSDENESRLPLPIAFLLTCTSFITTVSPLVLMLINPRLKAHIKLHFSCLKKDRNTDPAIILKNLSAEMPIPKDPEPVPKPKTLPSDPTIFLGTRAKKYKTTNLRISVVEERPQRVSAQRSSVACAAINAGLVLSAAGHRHIMINNFYSNQAVEEEELANVAKNLDTLYLF